MTQNLAWWVISAQIRELQLHVFNDSSEAALAWEAYSRIVYDNTFERVSFVMGKQRVSPIQRQTFPNLELQAATIGAKIAHFIKEQQNITMNKIVMRSDNAPVLHWLNSASAHQRHTTLIVNRLDAILTSTNGQE